MSAVNCECISPALEAVSPASNAFVKSLVGFKAYQISRTAGFTDADRADLSQELLATVSNGLKSYNPEISPYKPFVRSLVNNKTCNILRRQRARKRSIAQLVSLNVTIQDQESGSIELQQTIGERDLDRRLGRDRRLSDEEQSDLRMDLHTVLSKLDPLFQEIIRRRSTQTVVEISRDLGISRTTLQHWLQKIKKIFEDEGLEKYLEK